MRKDARKLPLANLGSVNPTLTVQVNDEPGPGGACHSYDTYLKDGSLVATVKFQEGAIHEAGINGTTNEALLAIVIDRLEGFSKGPYPSRETSIALRKCEEALFWMAYRTRERESRGVEGKHEK